MHRSTLRALLACLLPIALVGAQDAAALFQATCGACHLVDRFHVGPSLIEIARLYADTPDRFVAWCEQPQQKRPGVIEMPPMGFLGKDNLLQLHAHIVAITAGRQEIVVEGVDRFRASPSMRKRPQVLRTFLPECGPAAIAVAVDDDWSYAFDAGACRLRYVWRGDFADAWPVWQGNGNAFAVIVGDVVLRERRDPLPFPADVRRRFLGYRLQDGLPTFRYRVGDVEVSERIVVSEDGKALLRRFQLGEGAPEDLRVALTESAQIAYASEHGVFGEHGAFTPAAGHRRDFTIVMRLVEPPREPPANGAPERGGQQREEGRR